jgi:hypothetical protein
LPEDNLTIVCDVSIIGAERTLSGSKYPEESAKNPKPKHKCHKQLSTDLETAFHNKDFADVKVGVDFALTAFVRLPSGCLWGQSV